jgi:uncharacterized paraquat-inducible protein A
MEPLTSTGWVGWAMPLILLVAFASIIIAIELPFLRINKAILHSNSFSIVQGTDALIGERHFMLAAFMILFLIVFPLLNIAMMTHTWFTNRTPKSHFRRLEMIRIIGEWSMMSVFLLALGLLLTEGREMVTTQVRSGAIAIAISTAICVIAIRLARWLIKRRLRIV